LFFFGFLNARELDYWRLGENAKFRDMVMAVRADEAEHRNVNHTFSDLAHEQKKKD
jgi:hypothetical protein